MKAFLDGVTEILTFLTTKFLQIDELAAIKLLVGQLVVNNMSTAGVRCSTQVGMLVRWWHSDPIQSAVNNYKKKMKLH